ncbi:MAG: hypothetical protein Q7I99_02985, partial [Acholeplasmataceae bacterium]|nr:hypothetical protein [Acholeplasmataceae bacterium]
MKKFAIISISIVLAITIYAIVDSIVVKYKKDYLDFNSEPGETISVSDLEYFDTADYYKYLGFHEENFPQGQNISIHAASYDLITGDQVVLDSYENKNDVLLTQEAGSVTWSFSVPEAGYYNLIMNYYPYEGKSSIIERTLKINNEVPFNGARNITFRRIWGDKNAVIQDIHGNDIR